MDGNKVIIPERKNFAILFSIINEQGEERRTFECDTAEKAFFKKTELEQAGAFDIVVYRKVEIKIQAQ